MVLPVGILVCRTTFGVPEVRSSHHFPNRNQKRGRALFLASAQNGVDGVVLHCPPGACAAPKVNGPCHVHRMRAEVLRGSVWNLQESLSGLHHGRNWGLLVRGFRHGY